MGWKEVGFQWKIPSISLVSSTPRPASSLRSSPNWVPVASTATGSGSSLLVNQVPGKPIALILGSPDDLKFRSSMTLFARAAQDSTIFTEALQKYFAGQPDPLTLELLS